MLKSHDTSQGHDIALFTEKWKGIHVAQYVITRCMQIGTHHMLLEAMGEEGRERIAIKVPLEYGDGERLIRERLALEELQDVSLVPEYVMHGRCDAHRPLLAMEWISGSTLDQQLRLRGTLTRHDYFDLMLQLASGLSAMHARGYAANNLSLSNVLVHMGQVRLVDLGRATHIREPSQPGSGDARTRDIESLARLMRRALGDTTQPTRRFRCQELVPKRLERLIGRCEHSDIAERPAMHEVERLLKQMFEQSQASNTAVSEDEAEHHTSSAFFERESTRLNAHRPNESVEFIRQTEPGTNQETTRPRQRSILLDAQARERLRRRFVHHLAQDED